MSKAIKFEFTVIKKEQILDFGQTLHLVTLASPEALEQSQYTVQLGSTEEDFPFYQIGKVYEVLVRPLQPDPALVN